MEEDMRLCKNKKQAFSVLFWSWASLLPGSLIYPADALSLQGPVSPGTFYECIYHRKSRSWARCFL